MGKKEFTRTSEETIKEFADQVLDSFSMGENPNSDPFEIYAKRVRSHTQANPELFRERFSKGYEAIIHQLQASTEDLE